MDMIGYLFCGIEIVRVPEWIVLGTMEVRHPASSRSWRSPRLQPRHQTSAWWQELCQTWQHTNNKISQHTAHSVFGENVIQMGFQKRDNATRTCFKEFTCTKYKSWVLNAARFTVTLHPIAPTKLQQKSSPVFHLPKNVPSTFPHYFLGPNLAHSLPTTTPPRDSYQWPVCNNLINYLGCSNRLKTALGLKEWFVLCAKLARYFRMLTYSSGMSITPSCPVSCK